MNPRHSRLPHRQMGVPAGYVSDYPIRQVNDYTPPARERCDRSIDSKYVSAGLTDARVSRTQHTRRAGEGKSVTRKATTSPRRCSSAMV